MISGSQRPEGIGHVGNVGSPGGWPPGITGLKITYGAPYPYGMSSPMFMGPMFMGPMFMGPMFGSVPLNPFGMAFPFGPGFYYG